MRSLNRKKIKLIFIAIFIIAIFLCLRIVENSSNNKKIQRKINEGTLFLKKEEDKDLEKINKDIQKYRTEILIQKAVDNPEIAWQIFDNSIVIGDSRAVGFTVYDFLTEDQVFAKAGSHITDVLEYEKQIKALNPARIFLCFGLNDISMRNLWNTPEDYAHANIEIVNKLKEWVPNSIIFINSILPCTDAGIEKDDNFANIPKYNEVIQKACEDNKVNFIDNSTVASEHMDLYDVDGEHLQKEFYNFWVANMFTTVTSKEE